MFADILNQGASHSRSAFSGILNQGAPSHGSALLSISELWLQMQQREVSANATKRSFYGRTGSAAIRYLLLASSWQ
jgi:hypothetical protein